MITRVRTTTTWIYFECSDFVSTKLIGQILHRVNLALPLLPLSRPHKPFSVRSGTARRDPRRGTAEGDDGRAGGGAGAEPGAAAGRGGAGAGVAAPAEPGSLGGEAAAEAGNGAKAGAGVEGTEETAEGGGVLVASGGGAETGAAGAARWGGGWSCGLVGRLPCAVVVPPLYLP